MINYTHQHYEVLNSLLRDNNIIVLNKGVEVGVRHGDCAEFLCRNNPKLSLTLVDPYPPYMDVGYEFTEEEQLKIKKGAAKRLKYYAVTWVYEDSTKIAPLLENESLDFVFIDACHEYENVTVDIAQWYPKIRPGGLLCGHDIDMTGVNKAVTEFAAKLNKTFFRSDPDTAVWAIEV